MTPRNSIATDSRSTGAYAACRAIARREAKNFYYAFLALPAARRNAICAIYAFMRQADDLADDEAFRATSAARTLDAWLARMARRLRTERQTADPVFLAVRDATTRFAIPLSLLDELVAGVTMDLDHAAEPARRTPTLPLPISIATAIWWPRSWAWSASASSATRTRAPRSSPRRPASPSS